MTTEECFEAAARVETLMRDIYAGLAERYGGDPVMAQLFRDLAVEEEQHAHRIRLLARHQAEGTWARDTAARIARQLEAMSNELVSMVAELSADDHADRSGDVLQRVIDAEYRCGSLHAEVLAETSEIDVQLLFSSLARQDVRHKDLLDRAARSRARVPPPLPRTAVERRT